jgi:small conductance mechanosensitive channel
MKDTGLHMLRLLNWHDIALVLAILAGCQMLVLVVRWAVRRAAESATPAWRLRILRLSPLARLAIGIAGIVLIVPILVEPNLEDVVALLATVGLALAFALKDYVSSLAGGVATILENVYQPGDWIEIGGAYGEVKTIGLRAVCIVTADDTAIVIPHSMLWTSSVANASGGQHSLLCVTEFHLNADHDGESVRRMLREIGESSAYRKPDSPVKVVAAEMPWGTRYKLKAYVRDGREQFDMITDATLRAKTQLRAMGVGFARAPFTPDKSD